MGTAKRRAATTAFWNSRGGRRHGQDLSEPGGFRAAARLSFRPMIDFQTAPDHYRHWRLEIAPPIAWLTLMVDEQGGLGDYALKLNSYDLAVDIELNDAVERLRFEHPEVGAVVITSAVDRVFCAGANIRMLAASSHAAKVNFCKFTNETRCAIEDPRARQRYLAAINGPATGGGYELALATDRILLADDGTSAVAFPEVPLLAVLPGTGGLTRLIDKRHVRRDRADYFATTAEGVRGARARDWRLVDDLVKPSALRDAAADAALALARGRTHTGPGIALPPLDRQQDDTRLVYPGLRAALDGARGGAELTLIGPDQPPPGDLAALQRLGADFWPLALARALTDAILHLRTNRPELGVWVLKSTGDGERVRDYDRFLASHAEHWLVGEIRAALARAFKRLDNSSRSLIAVIEPGSCFAGSLLEAVLAADRSYMLDGVLDDDQQPAGIVLTALNDGAYPMANGLSRLATRFWGDEDGLARARAAIGSPLKAEGAAAAGLVTFIPDDIDWEDEIRLAVEARAGYSGDALNGMEANLRWPGPETLETKIFGRLSAWQNWIFQRPNAVGDAGALSCYGTGKRPQFDKERV